MIEIVKPKYLVHIHGNGINVNFTIDNDDDLVLLDSIIKKIKNQVRSIQETLPEPPDK